MIATAVGTRRYALLAQHCAHAERSNTGLETLILADEHFLASRLPTRVS
jgi:hypothetical protein